MPKTFSLQIARYIPCLLYRGNMVSLSLNFELDRSIYIYVGTYVNLTIHDGQ